MVSIGIRELRQHASRWVRMAKEGRPVAVTERGTLVAYLVPADEPAGARARLEAAGAYRPAVGSLLDLCLRPRARRAAPRSARLSSSSATRNAGDLPRHLGVREAHPR